MKTSALVRRPELILWAGTFTFLVVAFTVEAVAQYYAVPAGEVSAPFYLGSAFGTPEFFRSVTTAVTAFSVLIGFLGLRIFLKSSSSHRFLNIALFLALPLFSLMMGSWIHANFGRFSAE